MQFSCTIPGAKRELEHTDQENILYQKLDDPVVNKDSASSEVYGDSIIYGWVKKEVINVRSKPSINSEIITKLKKGESVILKEKVDEWWEVIVFDTVSAFIYGPLISTDMMEVMDPIIVLLFHLDNAQKNSGFRLVVDAENIGDQTAFIFVSYLWYGLTSYDQRSACLDLYDLWVRCLKKHGEDTRYAALRVYDDQFTHLATVRFSIWAGRVKVDLQ